MKSGKLVDMVREKRKEAVKQKPVPVQPRTSQEEQPGPRKAA